MLPRHLLDEFDPNNHCCVCNKAYKTANEYRKHLRKIHNMDLTPLKPRPNFSIAPNPNNASNHCDSCNWTLSPKPHYRRHLITVHKLVLPELKRSPLNPDILPDIHDPNFYCKSCKVKLKSRRRYRNHLKCVYKMELEPIAKPRIYDPTISVNDTKKADNTSCVICKFKYSTQKYHKRHTEIFHKDGRNTPIKNGPRRRGVNPHIQPDPNDPTFYCVSCNRHCSSRNDYRIHILLIHPNVQLEDINMRAIISPLMAEMDAGDENNKKCTICDWEYSDRSNYRKHMNSIHKNGKREPVAQVMNRLKLESIIAEIDAGDHNNTRCTICGTYYNSRHHYKDHIGRTHKDGNREPGGCRNRVNYSVVPVWNDPNKYCRSCQRTYSSTSVYRRHIKDLHGDVLQESM